MISRRYTLYRHAGLSLMAFSLFFSPCSASVENAANGASVVASQANPDAGKTGPVVIFHDDKLTVKAKSIPLEHLLDIIAETVGLRIFSASVDKTNNVVDVDMIDWQVEDLLADLLKDRNYLVVYNEYQENTGLFARTGTLSRNEQVTVAPVLDALPTPTKEEKVAQQAAFFQGQMDMLRQSIESGASDRFYENAIKYKDPAFVQDDRAELASYEERLAKLEEKSQ